MVSVGKMSVTILSTVHSAAHEYIGITGLQLINDGFKWGRCVDAIAMEVMFGLDAKGSVLISLFT